MFSSSQNCSRPRLPNILENPLKYLNAFLRTKCFQMPHENTCRNKGEAVWAQLWLSRWNALRTLCPEMFQNKNLMRIWQSRHEKQNEKCWKPFCWWQNLEMCKNWTQTKRENLFRDIFLFLLPRAILTWKCFLALTTTQGLNSQIFWKIRWNT